MDWRVRDYQAKQACSSIDLWTCDNAEAFCRSSRRLKCVLHFSTWHIRRDNNYAQIRSLLMQWHGEGVSRKLKLQRCSDVFNQKGGSYHPVHRISNSHLKLESSTITSDWSFYYNGAYLSYVRQALIIKKDNSRQSGNSSVRNVYVQFRLSARHVCGSVSIVLLLMILSFLLILFQNNSFESCPLLLSRSAHSEL